MEETLPSISQHIELLQKHWSLSNSEAEDDPIAAENELVFGQLLLMTEYQDYADELGRRNVLNILRHYVTALDLPDEIMETCIKSVKKLSSHHSDFIR